MNMAGESGGRPLLPQTGQMQSFPFAPQAMPPRENQRNYVFVDEHNRHKRLKVMRACEGCRRRKIKCDAATTNSWPCAACTRLKLNCVPPTVSYDKDSAPGIHTFEVNTGNDYGVAGVSSLGGFPRSHPMQQPHQITGSIASNLQQPVPATYSEGVSLYQPSSYMVTPTTQEQLQYQSVPQTSMPVQDFKYTQQQVYASPPNTGPSAAASDPAWRSEPSPSDISDALGQLKIDHTAIAPYIADRNKLAETPAVEEYEVDIPQHTGPDNHVRIPPEMMPSDQRAIQYFDYFFTNIHPYVPVLNRSSFYQQWHTSRDSISPLILEAVFACSSLMMEDPSYGAKWLALASKHEESFKDVPRLSTIQAMLLILKARESAPKRGYFYRSWVTVVNVVAMAKDLDLHEHLDNHRMGESCGSSIYDCAVKTRVWHCLYILEIMIGGPQGRVDFGVKNDTLDFSVPDSIPGFDNFDMQVSRQFIYWMRIAKNIRETALMYAKLRRRTKDWAVDPEYLSLHKIWPKWLQELPQDLQIAYPNDGSSPWIPSLYGAHLHCYHYLGLIMYYRPQIQYLIEKGDLTWQHNILLCYNAAKNMCRLQEAIIHDHGIPGMLCVQRGVSFAIYSVLTCIMLHLTALTAPDPELSSEARDFFVRHMRILEQCIPSWPMPEVHAQVDALREAFSADISKPFELKPSFPFGSPAIHNTSSPSSNDGGYGTTSGDLSLDPPGQVTYHTLPITPPMSATDSSSKTDSPVAQSLAMMAANQRHPQPQTSVQGQETIPWNPARIFNQWDTAFGTPPAPVQPQSASPPLRQPLPGDFGPSPQQQPTSQPGYSQPGSYSPHGSQVQTLPSSYAAPPNPYVSPSMWQDVVASTFGDGLKRRYDYSGTQMLPGVMSKRSR